MIKIPFEVNNGIKNMQIDKDLLEDAIQKKTKEHIFRLYAWSPKCISLGRNQKVNFINTEVQKLYDIDIVRRLTGGRALLHDNELTYSYICPISSLQHGDSIIESYKEILSHIFVEPFKKLGINLKIESRTPKNTDLNYCMQISTSADLCYNEKKLIGSAQYRKENYLLQHGSILFNYDKILLEKLFNEKIDETFITCMNEINPDISMLDVINLWSDFHDFWKTI